MVVDVDDDDGVQVGDEEDLRVGSCACQVNWGEEGNSNRLHLQRTKLKYPGARICTITQPVPIDPLHRWQSHVQQPIGDIQISHMPFKPFWVLYDRHLLAPPKLINIDPMESILQVIHIDVDIPEGPLDEPSRHRVNGCRVLIIRHGVAVNVRSVVLVSAEGQVCFVGCVLVVSDDVVHTVLGSHLCPQVVYWVEERFTHLHLCEILLVDPVSGLQLLIEGFDVSIGDIGPESVLSERDGEISRVVAKELLCGGDVRGPKTDVLSLHEMDGDVDITDILLGVDGILRDDSKLQDV